MSLKDLFGKANEAVIDLELPSELTINGQLN